MIPKRFSRKDELEGKIPLTAELIRKELDSDYSWYSVFTEDEYRRIAKYYEIDYDC